jgi:transcriptional regulator with XRE-family HTH domain
MSAKSLNPDLNLNAKIGRRIFVLRRYKKFSREELADKIGVSQQQIFKYEIGQNRIAVDRLIAIINALDVKLFDFFSASELNEDFVNIPPSPTKKINYRFNYTKISSAQNLIWKNFYKKSRI